MSKEKLKPCHAGSAYLCRGWTDEEDWCERKKCYFCFKCDRIVELNPKTGRWVHKSNWRPK